METNQTNQTNVIKHVNSIILGAGVSGLTTGLYLQKSKIANDFIIMEESSRVGGRVFTDLFDGNLVENGPNALILRKKEFVTILEDLAIKDQLVYPPTESKKRYICKNGKLILVSPKELLLKNELTDFKAKIKLLIGGYTSLSKVQDFDKNKQNDKQSVFDFFAKRFGNKFAENLITPLISGIYAGDARKVIMKSAFPKFYKFGMRSNSFLLGIIKSLLEERSEKNNTAVTATTKLKGNLASFGDGLKVLTERIYQSVKEQTLLNTSVISVYYDVNNKRWIVTTKNGDRFSCQNLITTIPSVTFAQLISNGGNENKWLSELTNKLKDINYSSVTVLHLLYNKADIKNPSRGFGFLNTHERTLDNNNNNNSRAFALGTLFASHMFPERTKLDQELFTVFLGGDLYPHIKNFSDEKLLNDIHSEISKTMLINCKSKLPNNHLIVRWDLAIPQYDLKHLNFKNWLENNSNESDKHNLYWSTNYINGVSVPDCMINAKSVAEKIIRKYI
ncbi:MAG: protoporphyrinogen oxidase [Oligoflexia bacterium]|nr:protoporphyrinogen oxidase [Oligoflexia bacterium]